MLRLIQLIAIKVNHENSQVLSVIRVVTILNTGYTLWSYLHQKVNACYNQYDVQLTVTILCILLDAVSKLVCKANLIDHTQMYKHCTTGMHNYCKIAFKVIHTQMLAFFKHK